MTMGRSILSASSGGISQGDKVEQKVKEVGNNKIQSLRLIFSYNNAVLEDLEEDDHLRPSHPIRQDVGHRAIWPLLFFFTPGVKNLIYQVLSCRLVGVTATHLFRENSCIHEASLRFFNERRAAVLVKGLSDRDKDHDFVLCFCDYGFKVVEQDAVDVLESSEEREGERPRVFEW